MAQTKKPRDEAQKWRWYKNSVRAAKNVPAYFYWKTDIFARNNRIRFLYANLIYMLYQNFLVTVYCKQNKETCIERWRYVTAQTNDHYGHINTKGMPYDRHKNYLRYSNFHQSLRNKRVGMMNFNFWCRDQNFRKYFEMRKKHDIRPSTKNFYHEAIYDEQVKANYAFFAMRNSRQAK